MAAGGKPKIAEQLEGALAWWRDAGVDFAFTDTPRDWLAKAEPSTEDPFPSAPLTKAPEPSPGRTRIGGEPENWPQDLAAFRAWWLSEPSLDNGGLSGRVAPRGETGAEIMVLVVDPEEGDGETLLAGPQGKLVAGIVTALGFSLKQTYLAAALPRRTPLPDWRQLESDGLGDVVRHHIGLAAPRRLLVFGSGVLSLLGHDPAKNPAFLPAINQEGRSLPLLAATDLAALLARPRAKAGLWQRLLDWTGTTET